MGLCFEYIGSNRLYLDMMISVSIVMIHSTAARQASHISSNQTDLFLMWKRDSPFRIGLLNLIAYFGFQGKKWFLTAYFVPAKTAAKTVFGFKSPFSLYTARVNF